MVQVVRFAHSGPAKAGALTKRQALQLITRNVLLYTTLTYISASVLSGVFANHFTFTEGIKAATLSEARLVLITMSPVLLMVSYVSLRSNPAKGKIDTLLQVLGQTALFLAPYYWAFNHA